MSMQNATQVTKPGQARARSGKEKSMTQTLLRGEVREAREAQEARGMQIYAAGGVRLLRQETRYIPDYDITKIVSATYEVDGSRGRVYEVDYLISRGRFASRCGCGYRPPRADVQCHHEVAVAADVKARNDASWDKAMRANRRRGEPFDV